MRSKDKTPLNIRLKELIRSQSVQWAVFTMRHRLYWLIGLLVTVIICWLAYSQVWRTWQQDPPLPNGVIFDNPQINEEVWQTIDAARQQRVNHQDTDFSSADVIFEKALEQKR